MNSEAMLARPSVAAAEPADLEAKSRRFHEERAVKLRSAAGGVQQPAAS